MNRRIALALLACLLPGCHVPDASQEPPRYVLHAEDEDQWYVAEGGRWVPFESCEDSE